MRICAILAQSCLVFTPFTFPLLCPFSLLLPGSLMASMHLSVCTERGRESVPVELVQARRMYPSTAEGCLEHQFPLPPSALEIFYGIHFLKTIANFGGIYLYWFTILYKFQRYSFMSLYACLSVLLYTQISSVFPMIRSIPSTDCSQFFFQYPSWQPSLLA